MTRRIASEESIGNGGLPVNRISFQSELSMCGVGGIFSPGGSAPDSGRILAGMVQALAHRGPDGSGVWQESGSGIGLCHTRLAVLDLSPRGNQPMTDPDGRGWITYNGEVYNYRQLRDELQAYGHHFVSDTDTEVVLRSCLHWGIEGALSRFIGMFAFALWIASERVLYLVRDRMGIKPLYYGRAGEDLVFGSELKALCVHPRFETVLDPRSLELFLMLQYVPSPFTIYRDAQKVPAGHFVRIDGDRQKVVQYWDPDSGSGVESGPAEGDEQERLEALLEDSVRMRLISDVPLGAFLSGGIDSALVVSQMGEEGADPPRTFTITYGEREFDESLYASRVARDLGTNHTSIKVSTEDLLSKVDELVQIFDEPFSDPSSLPMTILSERTRERVTVALSGDGGDELFGGYDRYRFVDLYHRRFLNAGAGSRRVLARLLGALPAAPLSRIYNRVRTGLSRDLAVENFAGKWEKLLKLLGQDTLAAAYQSAVGIFTSEETGRVLGRNGAVDLPDSFVQCFDEDPSGSSLIRRMMDLDSRTFLVDDVLTKVDRASMAYGLEVRVPLLDHRIVSLARRMPDSFLFTSGRGKTPLLKMAAGQLPDFVTQRPKMGFTLPLDSWLRGGLKDLMRDVLGRSQGGCTGLFDDREVGRLIDEHLSGKANHHEKIWNLMVFCRWKERWKPSIH